MGCGCVAALVGMVAPRFAIGLLQVFTDRLALAFESFVVGFLGFLLLPYTTLIYALVHDPVRGIGGLGWILVGLGVLVDLGAYASGPSGRRYDRRG